MAELEWIETRGHRGDNDNQFIMARMQDVGSILDQNKKKQNDELEGYSKSQDLKQVASIPMVVAEKWIKDDGVNWLSLTGSDREKYIRKKLNDPDNAFLRTDNRGLL